MKMTLPAFLQGTAVANVEMTTAERLVEADGVLRAAQGVVARTQAEYDQIAAQTERGEDVVRWRAKRALAEARHTYEDALIEERAAGEARAKAYDAHRATKRAAWEAELPAIVRASFPSVEIASDEHQAIRRHVARAVEEGILQQGDSELIIPALLRDEDGPFATQGFLTQYKKMLKREYGIDV